MVAGMGCHNPIALKLNAVVDIDQEFATYNVELSVVNSIKSVYIYLLYIYIYIIPPWILDL